MGHPTDEIDELQNQLQRQTQAINVLIEERSEMQATLNRAMQQSSGRQALKLCREVEGIK